MHDVLRASNSGERLLCGEMAVNSSSSIVSGCDV